MMFNQMFENVSKASESSFQLQQEMLRVWTQQWLTMPQSLGISAELARNLEKRWIELSIEMLNKQKEMLESNYTSGIQAIEQTFRLSEAKTSDDYQRMVEDLWRQLFKSSMDNSEAQLQEFRKWADKSFEMAQTSFNPAPRAQS
jgi:hypothetical protein